MKIGITVGEPTGIGTEVTIKALSKLKLNAVIIGAKNLIADAKERFKIDCKCDIIDCGKIKFEYGKPTKETGIASYEYILKGYELIKNKEIYALVTAPVCKWAINLSFHNFTGHTELLANLSSTKRFCMLMYGKKLKIALVTTHIPINDVAKEITKEKIYEKIELLDDFFYKYFNKKPKIGVCALNPHAEFGDEEKRIIIPAINEAKEKGIDVEGPFPSDTIFLRHYDIIIAMYHDQAMIPIKLLEFNTTVNVTVGLPFVRTAPDHGTAFDIAGKGIANPQPMISAIKLAKKLAKIKAKFNC